MEHPDKKMEDHKIAALAAKHAALAIVQGRPLEAGIHIARALDNDKRRAAARAVRR